MLPVLWREPLFPVSLLTRDSGRGVGGVWRVIAGFVGWCAYFPRVIID